jgi:hypothetical protein
VNVTEHDRDHKSGQRRVVSRGPRQFGRVRSLGYTVGYIGTGPYCQLGKSSGPERPTLLTRRNVLLGG